MYSYLEFMYNFFIFGTVFAGATSLSGSFLNQLSTMDANAFFYLLGVLVYCLCLIECVYFVRKDANKNISKLRVFLKATLLAFAHYNPIIVCFVVFCLDTGIAIVEYNSSR